LQKRKKNVGFACHVNTCAKKKSDAGAVVVHASHLRKKKKKKVLRTGQQVVFPQKKIKGTCYVTQMGWCRKVGSRVPRRRCR